VELVKKMRLARQYAGVFLTEQMGKGEILILAAEMQFFADTLIANPDLAEFFAAPAVSREDQLRVIDGLARSGDFSSYTRELLEILVRHRRGEIIFLVSRELHFIADVILNRIRVRMTTAAEPSEASRHAARRNLPELVILSSLILVRKNRVRLTNLLKSLFSLLVVGILVGVIFADLSSPSVPRKASH